MEFQIKEKRSPFWYYFWQFLYLIPIAITVHYCKSTFFNSLDIRYHQQTNVDVIDVSEKQCKQLFYELIYLRKEIMNMKDQLDELQAWKTDFNLDLDAKIGASLDTFYSDQIGLLDYASEYSGGSIISTPDTISYPSKFGLRLFGAIDWILESQPKMILQHQTFPGKCYAFYGDKGRIRIKLGQPTVVTHVSLEHLRIGGSVRSAPKDFEILGFDKDGEENLGSFVYDLNDAVIQTFGVAPKNQTFEMVELRILSNHGEDEMTCVYRFRVHSLNLNLK